MTNLKHIEVLVEKMSEQELLEAIELMIHTLEEKKHSSPELEVTPEMWKELLDKIEAHKKGELTMLPAKKAMAGLKACYGL